MNEEMNSLDRDLRKANEEIELLHSKKRIYSNAIEAEQKRNNNTIARLKSRLEINQQQTTDLERSYFTLEEAEKMHKKAFKSLQQTNEVQSNIIAAEHKKNLNLQKALETVQTNCTMIEGSKKRKLGASSQQIKELKEHINTLNSSIASSLIRETQTLNRLRDKYVKAKANCLSSNINKESWIDPSQKCNCGSQPDSQ
jgi:chromosome segregation ATPase